MAPFIAALLPALASALAAPLKNAVTGAANKALAAGGVTAVSIGAMPSELELFAAIGYLLGWSPETVHAAATIAAFVLGFVTTYVTPNRAPPSA